MKGVTHFLVEACDPDISSSGCVLLGPLTGGGKLLGDGGERADSLALNEPWIHQEASSLIDSPDMHLTIGCAGD